jgi:RNA polymerase sigma-70 factor, ECF subfamily
MSELDEAEMLARIAEGKLDEATRLIVDRYGGELFAYIASLERNRDDAEDVLAQLCEDVWRGLPGFRRESSLRTWSYTLARHALARFRRDPYLRRGRRLATDEASQLAARVSSGHSSPPLEERLARARALLDDDDQTILVLRIDRRMSWRDVTAVLSGDGEPLQEAAVRKRFERIKAELRRLIAQENR